MSWTVTVLVLNVLMLSKCVVLSTKGLWYTALTDSCCCTTGGGYALAEDYLDDILLLASCFSRVLVAKGFGEGDQ